MARHLQSAALIASAALLSSCETVERHNFRMANRIETYRCAMPRDRGGHFRCDGRYADLVKAPPAALGDCAELAHAFQASKRARVLVLSHQEFYPSQHLGAVLLEPVNFKATIAGHGPDAGRTIYVRVPTGFVTDFTSVPIGLPQAFHRTFSKTDMPAIAHDFLYALGREPCDRASTRAYCQDGAREAHEAARKRSRLLADEVIEQGMKDNFSRGMSYGTVFLAVRLGGAGGYGRREELRFLNQNAATDDDLVVPVDEFDKTEGYAKNLRNSYVRVCPEI